MKLSASVAVVLLVATQRSDAQTTRRGLDGATAIRLSAGKAVPVGSEDLAKAWSGGPTIAMSLEHFLRDPQSTREFSLGVLFRYSSHPFDEAGFRRDFRPGGDIPLTASGPAASVATLSALGRVAIPRGRVSPNFSFALGAFNTTRGDVTYAAVSGTKAVSIASKAGAEVAVGVGIDLEFLENAISLEAIGSIGASAKDEPEGAGQLTCNSEGCGVPRQRTQVFAIRAGVRRVLAR